MTTLIISHIFSIIAFVFGVFVGVIVASIASAYSDTQNRLEEMEFRQMWPNDGKGEL